MSDYVDFNSNIVRLYPETYDKNVVNPILYGLQNQLNYLKAITEIKPLNEKITEQTGLFNPRIIVLAGPSHGGKTALLKKFFSEINALTYTVKLIEILSENTTPSEIRSTILNFVEVLKQEVEKNSKKPQFVVIDNIDKQLVELRNQKIPTHYSISMLLEELEELVSNAKIHVIITTQDYGELKKAITIPNHHLISLDYPSKETIMAFLQNIKTQINDLAVSPLEINEKQIVDYLANKKITLGELKSLFSKLFLAHTSIAGFEVTTETIMKELSSFTKNKNTINTTQEATSTSSSVESVEDIMTRIMHEYSAFQETENLEEELETKNSVENKATNNLNEG